MCEPVYTCVCMRAHVYLQRGDMACTPGACMGVLTCAHCVHVCMQAYAQVRMCIRGVHALCTCAHMIIVYVCALCTCEHCVCEHCARVCVIIVCVHVNTVPVRVHMCMSTVPVCTLCECVCVHCARVREHCPCVHVCTVHVCVLACMPLTGQHFSFAMQQERKMDQTSLVIIQLMLILHLISGAF